MKFVKKKTKNLKWLLYCIMLKLHANIGNETATVRIALNPAVIRGHMRMIHPLHSGLYKSFYSEFIMCINEKILN